MKEIKALNKKMYKKFNQEKKRNNVPESEYVTEMRNPQNIVEFDNLKTYFYTDQGTVKAVDGVTFEIPMGNSSWEKLLVLWENQAAASL